MAFVAFLKRNEKNDVFGVNRMIYTVLSIAANMRMTVDDSNNII